MLGLLLGVGAAGCGGDDASPGEPSRVDPVTATTRPPAFAGDGSWVLAVPPDGFVAVLAEVLPESQQILYQRISSAHQIYDAPITLSVGGEQQSERYLQDATPVVVQGRDGWVGRLQSDGVVYGIAVVWPDGPDRWVRVAWSEPDVTADDVLAVAEQARPVDAAEWNRLLRALAIDSHIGRTDPDAIEIVAVEGEVAGVAHRLIALVPPDYPLGGDDRRRTCYVLEVGGQRQAPRCDSHPWWDRIGDVAYVYGRAAAGAADVLATAGNSDVDPAGGTTVTATAALPGGSPDAVFLAIVPGDWCLVNLVGAEGTFAAPLPGQPFHAECLAAGG